MALAESAFLFLTCQRGAEAAIKQEIGREWRLMRFAFSRPGFLTFKLPPGHHLSADFEPPLGICSSVRIFARSDPFRRSRGSGEESLAGGQRAGARSTPCLAVAILRGQDSAASSLA